MSGNQYYNLQGWLRDVRAVLGDNTERADLLRDHLADLFTEILGGLGIGTDDELGTEVEPEDADDDVEMPGRQDGLVIGALSGKPRRGFVRAVGGSAPLENASRGASLETQPLRRATPVAGARRSVKGGTRGTKSRTRKK